MTAPLDAPDYTLASSSRRGQSAVGFRPQKSRISLPTSSSDLCRDALSHALKGKYCYQSAMFCRLGSIRQNASAALLAINVELKLLLNDHFVRQEKEMCEAYIRHGEWAER